MKQALIIMAKRPEAGKTKTRLCPPLTLEQSAQLYECFLTDIVDIVRQLRQTLPNLHPFFAYSPHDSEPYFTQLAPDFALVPQIGDTLGERLDYVLSSCLNQGFDHAAAINSDSPTLPVEYLAQAFEQLGSENSESKNLKSGDLEAEKSTDIVFGPSEDGGYYLIGVTKPWITTSWSRIVRDVTMSTPTVLTDSLEIAKQENATVTLLPQWYDIDTIDELMRLATEPNLNTDSNLNTESNKATATHTLKYIRDELDLLAPHQP